MTAGVLLAVSSACSAPDAVRVSATTVTDSAGVRIIELALDTVAPPTLGLAAEPSLRLPSEDSDADLFRVEDALPLPGGGLAIANGGNSEILIFDAAGRLRQRVGRAGSGPGEFRSLRWLARVPPDSIAAGDPGLGRVTVFDSAGAVLRVIGTAGNSTDITRTSGFAPQPIGIFGDGSVAMALYGPVEPLAGPVRRALGLARFEPSAATFDSLGSWPGDEVHLLPVSGQLHVLIPPFARTTLVRVQGQTYGIADSESSEVRTFDIDRGLVGIIRWTGSERAVTGPVRDAVIRDRLRDFPPGPEYEQRVMEMERMSTHTNLPALGNMHAGADGRVWVSRFTIPGDSTTLWFGVDPQAAAFETLRIPAGSTVLAFEPDAVILLTRDTLDREVVERHRIIHHAADPAR